MGRTQTASGKVTSKAEADPCWVSAFFNHCHGGRATLALPHIPRWEGKKGGDIFLLIGHIFHSHLVTDSLWPLQCTSSHLRGCPLSSIFGGTPSGPGG